MQNHGVFSIGRDAKAAVKAAVMCEDVARSTHIARQLGLVVPLPQDDVDTLFNRYQNVYGQTGARVKQIWFLTGSQGLYGEDTLKQVIEQSQAIAEELGRAVPAEIVWKPVLTDSDGIHRAIHMRAGENVCVRRDADALRCTDDSRPGGARPSFPVGERLSLA